MPLPAAQLFVLSGIAAPLGLAGAHATSFDAGSLLLAASGIMLLFSAPFAVDSFWRQRDWFGVACVMYAAALITTQAALFCSLSLVQVDTDLFWSFVMYFGTPWSTAAYILSPLCVMQLLRMSASYDSP
jgi:hypothetical protein